MIASDAYNAGGKEVNIAIVEDEKKEAERLVQLIEKYSAEHDIALACKVFNDGLDFLSGYKQQFEIVFLDIQMPFVDGLSVAAKLRQLDMNVIIVFVTNMVQYAIKGYEVEASDFIVKPLEYNVFEYKFKRILSLAKKHMDTDMVIINGSEQIRVRVSDIDYVEVSGHKVIYHINDRVIESWDVLANVYEALKPFDFCYCNSCYIVNLNHVRGVGKDMVDVNGVQLKISRGKKKEFVHRLSLNLIGGGI